MLPTFKKKKIIAILILILCQRLKKRWMYTINFRKLFVNVFSIWILPCFFWLTYLKTLTVVYFNCACFSLIVVNVAVRLFFLLCSCKWTTKRHSLVTSCSVRQNYTQNCFSHGGYLIWKWLMVFACGLSPNMELVA